MRKKLLIRLLLIILSINISSVAFSQGEKVDKAKTDKSENGTDSKTAKSGKGTDAKTDKLGKGTDAKTDKSGKSTDSKTDKSETNNKETKTNDVESDSKHEPAPKNAASESNTTDKAKTDLDARFSSLETDIKIIKNLINQKPILGILDWTEIAFIILCALLMGIFGMVALSRISSLKRRVKYLEDKLNPANSYQGTGTSVGSLSNYNPRIDNKIENIEQKINRYDNDIALLQSKIQQLERAPTTVASSTNTTPAHQANTPQQPLIYISCRGAVESDGITLNVSPNSDNNSIFQINPNNQEISVMRVEDITLYEVVINSISNFYGILKSDRPPIDGQHKKITTLKAGKVKKLSENQWQIVDKQLIEVKFE